jgi:hypothetical protein
VRIDDLVYDNQHDLDNFNKEYIQHIPRQKKNKFNLQLPHQHLTAAYRNLSSGKMRSSVTMLGMAGGGKAFGPGVD